MKTWNLSLDELEARIAPDVIGEPPGEARGLEPDEFGQKQETVGSEPQDVAPPGLNKPEPEPIP
jgi:hypothetical protein